MMKYLNKIIVLLVFSLAFISCDENENFEILPAQESFQIVTPSSGSVIVLNDTNLENNALFISWEATKYSNWQHLMLKLLKQELILELQYLWEQLKLNNFGITVEELNTFY